MKNNKLKTVLTLAAAVLVVIIVALTCVIFSCNNSDNSGDSQGRQSSTGGEDDGVVVSLLQDTAYVAEFETIKLVAVVDGSSEPVTWTSSDVSVATVDENGLVYGVKSGSCDIVVALGEHSAKCALTVTETIYAPVIKTTERIVIEKDSGYTGEVGVYFKGEDVTADSEIGCSLADGYEENCSFVAGGGKVTFTAEKLGEAAYYLTATYKGIYVSKRITVKVVEAIASVVPDGDDVLVGEDGYEMKLYTVSEAGNTQMPLSFTVYQGNDVVEKAEIEWDLTAEGYNPAIATVSGKNGSYTVKKVAAGSTRLSGIYRTPSGKEVTVSVKVTVEKAVKTLDLRPVIEVENLQPVVMPDSFSGTVKAVTLDGVNVYSYKSGKSVYLSKSKLPVTASELGTKEMTVSTADIDYKFTVELYTLIISNKAELDSMRDLARSNGGNTAKTGVLDGYYILDADIVYDGEYISMTDSGELWSVNNVLGGSGWNDPSKYGFKGIFDGRGHNIEGLTVKYRTGEKESGGLFGYLNKDGIIRNVSFTAAGLYENNGFICSYGSGLIENVSVSFASVGKGNENRDLFSEKNTPRTMGAFFSCGADDSAVVRNCVVDAMDADIRYVTNKDRSYLANLTLGTAAKKAENLVVLCNHPQASKILAESGSPYTATSYGELSSNVSVKGAIEEFDENVWSLINGIPFLKSFAASIDTDRKIAFVSLYNVISLGESMTVKTNTRYCELTVDGLYDGVTFENGVIRVSETAATGEISVKAISYINGSEATAMIEICKTENVTIAHERKLIEISENRLDLSFAAEYLGDTATVSYNDEVIIDGALVGGIAAADFTKIGSSGELTLKIRSKKDGVYYTFDFNVLLVTKVIRNAEDWAAVRIGQANIDANLSVFGYYVLANDIDFGDSTFNQDLTFNGVVKFWEKNFGFRGTFDGFGHKLLNVKVGVGGMFGYIGNGAIIRNVNFENVSYIGAYRGSLLAYTVHTAKLSDITVKVSSYVNFEKYPYEQGLLAARILQDCNISNVKIDASSCDVYSAFGYVVKSNVFSGVEIKVGSLTILGYDGDDSNKSEIFELDGVSVMKTGE